MVGVWGGGKVGYARVSTIEQSLALQRRALNDAGCIRIFEDEGTSGATTSRPALDAALDYVRGGDTLVVWKLDRLGRSLRHLIDVVSGLEERGVAFQSITEGFDTTVPSGRMLFHVIGALAEMERELIRERTIAGLAAARAAGKTGGRPSVMSPERVQLARRMLNEGARVTEIALVLKVSRGTIYRHCVQEA